MSHSPQSIHSRPTTPSKQRKRKPDPFLDLAATPLQTPLASPDLAEFEASRDGSGGFFLQKLILTPILFTSFIFSLFLVNRRTRAYRVAEHPPPGSSSSLWTRISPWHFLSPGEPYQSPSDSTWMNVNSNKTQGSDGSIPGVDGQAELDRGQRKRNGWVLGKKHRKIAKMEVSEAFDMHWKIMVVLGIAWTLGFLAVAWTAKKLVAVVW